MTANGWKAHLYTCVPYILNFYSHIVLDQQIARAETRASAIKPGTTSDCSDARQDGASLPLSPPETAKVAVGGKGGNWTRFPLSTEGHLQLARRQAAC